MLLDAGAKIDVRNRYQATPLLYAATDEAAVALIKADADTASKDMFGETIDRIAVQMGFRKPNGSCGSESRNCGIDSRSPRTATVTTVA